VNAAALSTTGCFAVIAGGGTAGHVLPALAIAEALVERGHPREAIHLVGARRGMETRLVPAEGYPHTFYDVVGVQRAWSWANLRRNVAFGPKLLAATARASSWSATTRSLARRAGLQPASRRHRRSRSPTSGCPAGT
jgi:UDP:flavonoid glycosyltransferase YjiC (YdhE family)